MHCPDQNRKQGERGFALLMVFLLAAGIALMLYAQIPRVAFESERDKEQLLIDRGEQYKRAIQEFYVAFKRYPNTIEELEKTNDKRFLRKRYIDPYTGKDEWRLVHTNGFMLTDSLVQKPPAAGQDPNNPNKDQLASNLGPGGTSPGFGATGAGGGGFSPIGVTPNATPGAPGGVPGQPPGPGEVNPALIRRPSDRVITAGQFGAPAGGFDPNNPNSVYNPNPQGNTGDPNNPGQFPPGQPFPGQQGLLPGQPLPPQVPGQFGAQQNFPPGFPQPPNNFNSVNSTDFPPISLQAMQQQQGNPNQNNGLFQPAQQFPVTPGQVPNQLPGQVPGQVPGQIPGQQFPVQYPGQQFPGQQFPGQQFPGQQLPGQALGNQVRLGQNGQFIPVQPQQPFGAQPVPGGQPFPGGQGQTFPQIPGTDPQAVPGGQVPNQALNLINQLLTTPRQPPGGIGGNGPGGGGGTGIAGVASMHEGATLKLYKDRQKYKEWEFIFDPNENAPKAPAFGNPLGTGNGLNPGVGATPTTPFGPPTGGGLTPSTPFGPPTGGPAKIGP